MYVRECERARETTTAKSRSVRWPARTHRRGDRGREGGVRKGGEEDARRCENEQVTGCVQLLEKC